jgi:hypothetical protein
VSQATLIFVQKDLAVFSYRHLIIGALNSGIRFWLLIILLLPENHRLSIVSPVDVPVMAGEDEVFFQNPVLGLHQKYCYPVFIRTHFFRKLEDYIQSMENNPAS